MDLAEAVLIVTRFRHGSFRSDVLPSPTSQLTEVIILEIMTLRQSTLYCAFALLSSCGQREPATTSTTQRVSGDDLKSKSTDELLRMLAPGETAKTVKVWNAETKQFDEKKVLNPSSRGYQRFIPVPRQPENVTGVPWSGVFALDTKTGQLCLTYEGDFPDKWKALPMCVELMVQNPD